jgi:hypothetical protein
MLKNSDTSPSLIHSKALVDLRNELIISLYKGGLEPSELSYVFNIQRQLINHIINPKNDKT